MEECLAILESSGNQEKVRNMKKSRRMHMAPHCHLHSFVNSKHSQRPNASAEKKVLAPILAKLHVGKWLQQLPERRTFDINTLIPTG